MGRCRVKRQRPILCGKKVKSEWRKSKFAVGDLFHQLLDGFQAGSLSTGAHYAGGTGGSGKAQPEIYRAVKQECDGRPFSYSSRAAAVSSC